MTTRQTERQDMLQIQETLRDITQLKRRQLLHRMHSVEWRIDESLIDINRVVLAWQKERAGIV